MRIRKKIKNLACNICIICSMSLLLIFVLDWYNPYMDFLGHARELLYPLCICSIYMGIYSQVEKEERIRIHKKNRRW